MKSKQKNATEMARCAGYLEHKEMIEELEKGNVKEKTNKENGNV